MGRREIPYRRWRWREVGEVDGGRGDEGALGLKRPLRDAVRFDGKPGDESPGYFRSFLRNGLFALGHSYGMAEFSRQTFAEIPFPWESRNIFLEHIKV